ncbi:Hypothetical predicted protein, partial [Paramuricea clavata]
MVAGDLNCDLLKCSPESDAFYNLCSILNLSQLVTLPTRVTPTTSSLIDVIMTSNTAIIKETRVIETHVSDHHLIDTCVNMKLPKPPVIYTTSRSYKKYQPKHLENDLVQISWQDILCTDDVNDKVDQFNRVFLAVLDKHAPLKTTKLKYRSMPFIDQNVKELMSKRDKMYKIARQTGALRDWNQYTMMRDDVKRKLRESERKYVNKELEKNHSSNAMWKVIRKCIPRKEMTKPVYTKDKKLLAEEFNEYFTTVGRRTANLSENLGTEHNLFQLQLSQNAVSGIFDEFKFYAVTSEEIRQIVNHFSPNKAPGWDKITVNLIKDSLIFILPIITDLVNSSLLTSVFPTAWKRSEVTPVLKEGDYQVADNNRPISLLPVLSKVCERVALKQMNDYMESRKRLTKHQSGNLKDVESAKIQLNEDLERIAAWSCQNSLLMNPDKTKLLLIGSPQMLKKIPANFCLTLLGKEIYP